MRLQDRAYPNRKNSMIFGCNRCLNDGGAQYRQAQDMPAAAAPSLRILHATRAPVGGIFRHILDLANGQAAQGHQVGIVADSLTGGERAEKAFAEIAPRMALGVHRMPIRREPHPADLWGLVQFGRLVRNAAPDVLHAHGAKGGAFARYTSAAPRALRVYTPHGGSLHYSPKTLKGKVYAAIERNLMGRTGLFLFESEFARDIYLRVIGTPKCLVRCVFNGVTAAEFDPVAPVKDASDVAYVGEFRHIKGADILVDAVARLRQLGRPVTLSLCGDGEEMAALKAQCERLGIADAVRFHGFLPARTGFAQGQVLVVPSRGDSMPYVVIEAAAAGVPMLASRVGGIPEIFGPMTDNLVPPGDVHALADAIAAALDAPDTMRDRAHRLKERVLIHFSRKAMVEGIMQGYRDALAMVNAR